MKELRIPVVKVKSYLEDEVIGYGSGVFLSDGYVLTASHTLRGDRHVIMLDEAEKETFVKTSNHIAALLAVELGSEWKSAVYSETGQAEADRIWVTEEELLTENSAWTAEGFITDEQIFHFLSGKGLVSLGNQECQNNDTDYRLKNIENGYAENYQGLSGAPVMCGRRIVGILQIQNLTERGVLGLEMASVQMFKELLPSDYFRPSVYREEFEERARSFTKEAIDKNIVSRKYIPDIFVEEGRYKENFRYYAEPELFLKKVVEEVGSINLRAVNRLLTNKKELELDFSDIARFAAEHTMDEMLEVLDGRLKAAVRRIEKAETRLEDAGLSREKRFLMEDGYSYAVKYILEEVNAEICFFRYKTILITKDAGQGKTNFLCDFTSNFLMKKGFPVLFYNAYDFREPFMNRIKRDLTLDEKYSWEYVRQALTRIWEREHRAVTIIIDGLNENTALNDLGGYVSDFLKETQSLSFIKVVLSTRNELLEERFGQLNSETLGDCFYRMDMKHQSNKFMERIFWGYLKYFDIEIMENSLLDRTFETLAHDTLLLRFFCEVNQGKRQVRMLHVYKYSLFQKYYEIKKNESVQGHSPGREEIFDKLIDHICQLMIESRQFSEVPRKGLTEEELVMFDRLLEADVIFKQEVQVKRGLLKETETVLGFTFDEFRDFCLTRYILKNNDGESFSAFWRTMHTENWSILEGAERYIFFLARTEGEELLPILQREKEYERLYWQNVWELEETEIVPKDIQIWRKELLVGGKYTASIVSFLLSHRDRSYFRTLNVDLLFDLLNELAENLPAFDMVTKMLFRKTKKDFQGRETGERAAVLSCDSLTEAFRKNKEDDKFIKRNTDFIKLSIYMVEIDIDRIGAMWADVYVKTPEVVEGILEGYVMWEGLPPLIAHNLELIFDAIFGEIKETGEKAELEEPESGGKIKESAAFRKVEELIKLDRLRSVLVERVQKYNYQAINSRLAAIWTE
nr:hypothetical protein [uncultured Acetatifactor sp.]